jgi:hypothetical protein
MRASRGGLVRGLGTAVVLVIGAAACDGAGNQAEGDSAPALAPSFRSLPGQGNFVMIIPAGMPADRFLDAARDKCGAADMCQVWAWSSEADAARGIPMTDREAATMAFSFSVNRSTGHEQSVWDCARFPRSSDAECMAKD